MNSILLVLAILIVAGLAGYAIMLAKQLKQAKQEIKQAELQAEQKLKDHQLKLIEDIRFVARSMMAEQCEITEGVLRLNFLLNALDEDIWNNAALPTLREHYQEAATMPILDAYKALTKQQQFELDNHRYRLENDNKTAILKEMQWLVSYQYPSITLVH